MDADGHNQRQLTFDEAMESSANVSPDGRSIAYAVASQGVWKVEIDGGGRRQLTQYGMFPEYSADGNWIYYTLPRDMWRMWKVPAAGGDSVRVTEHPAVQPAVSPDGKLIAYMTGRAEGTPKLYVTPIDGGEPLYILDMLPLRKFDIQWLSDGRSIAYKANENGIQKIVSQPLDGLSPQVLIAANSESEAFAGWGFSRDGRRLYYSSGPIHRNVVMFTLGR
jgi:Tol biopolymer transport system component